MTYDIKVEVVSGIPQRRDLLSSGFLKREVFNHSDLYNHIDAEAV